MAEEMTSEEMDANIVEDMNDFTSFEDIEDDEPVEEEEKEEKAPKEEPTDSDESIKLEEIKKDDKEEPAEESTDDVKTFEATIDGKTVKIPEDATFKHKVDGKEVELSIKDMLNRESGEQTIEQRMSKIGQEKSEFIAQQDSFIAERDSLVTKVDDFVLAIEDNDSLGAIESLAKIANVNPIDLRTHFIDIVKGDVAKYLQMSEEEQKTLDKDLEVDYYKQRDEHRNQVEEQTAQTQQESNDVQQKVIGLQTKYGISDDNLLKLLSTLQGNSEEEISIEALENLHLSESSQGKASSLIDQIDPTYSKNEQYVKDVVEFRKANPDLSDSDVVESIKAAVEADKAKSDTKATKGKATATQTLKNRIDKNNRGTSTKTADETNEDYLEDVVDFDEID